MDHFLLTLFKWLCSILFVLWIIEFTLDIIFRLKFKMWPGDLKRAIDLRKEVLKPIEISTGKELDKIIKQREIDEDSRYFYKGKDERFMTPDERDLMRKEIRSGYITPKKENDDGTNTSNKQ